MPADPGATDDDGPRIGDGVDALGDLWQFGLDTTRSMAQRVEELYAGLSGARPCPGSTTSCGSSGSISSVRSTCRSTCSTVSCRVARRVERRDDLAPVVTEAVAIRATPGEQRSAAVWVHNVSAAEQCAPDVRCGPLTMFDGTALPDAGVQLVTSTIPIAANNSRRLDLVVDVPGDAAPGVYHGLVLARPPDASIRVRVEVTNGDGRGDNA